MWDVELYDQGVVFVIQTVEYEWMSIMSPILNGKMGGVFTVASIEFDSVVMEMNDVHKAQKPDVTMAEASFT